MDEKPNPGASKAKHPRSLHEHALLLLLLFIPGENPMGLYGKLLYYIYLGKPFGKKICVFLAP